MVDSKENYNSDLGSERGEMVHKPYVYLLH